MPAPELNLAYVNTYNLLDSLFDKVVSAVPEEELMAEAERLHVAEDGEIFVGDEEEVGLVFETLLFEPHPEGTRFEQIVAELDTIEEGERKLVPAVLAGRFSLYERRRDEESFDFYWLHDLCDEGDFYVAAESLNPMRVDECVATRLIEVDGFFFPSFCTPAIHPGLKKFFREPEARLELAQATWAEAEITDETKSPRLRVSAIFNGLAAQELSMQRGARLKMPKKKRSLADKKKRKRRKR